MANPQQKSRVGKSETAKPIKGNRRRVKATPSRTFKDALRLLRANSCDKWEQSHRQDNDDQHSREVTLVAERERQHLAQDLHDGLLQQLIAIRCVNASLHRALITADSSSAA